MNPLDLVTEPLQYDFMLRALAATSLAAVVCALLSCWLVLIGWSLMGDAVSHAVLPGVVLSYALGLPFALGAIVFGLLAVVLIGAVRESRRVAEDAAIGIVFTTLFALGLVLISVTPSHTDLGHILFGSVLGVSRGALAQIAVLAGVALTVRSCAAATSPSTPSTPPTRGRSASPRAASAPSCWACSPSPPWSRSRWWG